MTANLKENRLFYDDRGVGETCVLLHGFLEERAFWDPVLKALAPRYRLITIDLPGHGSSPTPQPGSSLLDYALAVKSILDILHLREVYLVGHSMGGYVGLAFAKAFPERCLGLLLLNSTPKPDTPARIKNRKHGIALAKKNLSAIVRMSIANLFSPDFHQGHSQLIAEVQRRSLKTPLDGYIAAQHAMMQRPDYTKFWKLAPFKKLMILATDDPLINAGTLQAEFGDIDTLLVPGGHMSLLEHPDEVIEGIRKFLP